ncbi:MAG: cytochrome c biogenesis heme-transporting ATPase CcmA [Pseudomonadales bacterium]|nr:cytochrome c biogenesis heme-transporting ATPase CcmA [Pseudomonadales bacterium]
MHQDSVKTSQSSADDLITAQQLFCERDDRVLFSNLEFSLRRGQVLQIKGSNGTGKTTLLRIICGLNQGYEGELNWQGEPMAEHLESFYGELLYIGHRVGVNKVLTPLENLRWSAGLQGPVSEEQLYQALADVGLRGFEESACGSLSAGQQQRVALARLLLSPATLWALDEPFTTLDVSGVALLEKLLAEHAGRGGAVLVTTHHALQVPDLKVLNLG